MLSHTDPFTAFDHFFDGFATNRSASGNAPLDAYRRGENVWVHLDLPGVAADSLDIDVERNVLTVTAERKWAPEEGDQLYRSERKQGTFRRQLHLGEGLDTTAVEADYHDGVLTLRIPVAEQAKPRKISINTSASPAVDAGPVVDTVEASTGTDTTAE